MGHRESPGVRAVKTAVTTLLLAAAVSSFVTAGSGALEWPGRAAVLIVLGLALTVPADWFLAPIDNSRTFVWGLAFFLGGYLIYGIAFLVAVSDGINVFGSVPLGLLVAVYLPAAAVGIAQYTTLKTLPKGLRIPVIAYMVVVSNLLAAGVLYGADRYADAPFRASLVLFAVVMIYLSDSLIAHNLFRRPLRAPQLSIMPTYYLGQIAVVLALIL